MWRKKTSIALGNEVEEIYNKGRLSEHDRASLNFLKAAIHFIPLATEDGADFENAALYLLLWAGSLLLWQERVTGSITFPKKASVT